MPIYYRQRVEEALDRAKRAQEEFWNCMSELEEVLGGEVEATRDLSDVTVDGLIEEFREEESE